MCWRVGSGGFTLSSGLPVAERADEPACLGAVEHDGRGLAVLEGAEPDECGLCGGAHVRAVLVGVDDERRAELRGERGEGAARLRALLERARVVAEEEVDLAAAGEAASGRPARARPPGTSRDPLEATRLETRRRRRDSAGGRDGSVFRPSRWCRRKPSGTGPGAAVRAWAFVERLGVVVVSVHEQKLEVGAAEQGTGGAEEAAPFRVARQVAEVAEGEERVAALLDCALDQVAQVASVAVQVTEDEQAAHSNRGYRARFCSRADGPGLAFMNANQAWSVRRPKLIM